MIIKLSSKEIVQIAKAIKCGWLDTDKVMSLKHLAHGYNPPKKIKKREINYYLKCLYKGWGYIPTDQSILHGKIRDEVDDSLLKEWSSKIDDGTIYKELVKDAFWGLVALKVLGGEIEDKESEFDFLKHEPDF